MKKVLKLIAVVMMAVLAVSGLTILTACGGEKNIQVIGREDGSGTRDAFDSLIKNANGDKLEDATLVSSIQSYSSTEIVLSNVASLNTAIGYVSLGSVKDSVKKVKIDGVEATPANVLNDTYKLWRPFSIMTNKSVTLTDATQDFVNFLTSAQAQAVVEEMGYVTVASEQQYTAPEEALSGTIIIRGSTSVDPLMVELMGEYQSIGGDKVKNIKFEKDCQGTSAGKTAVKGDKTGNVIGLASSTVTDDDKTTYNLNSSVIAKDAIAVIVHKDNALDSLTVAQIYDIYTGVITKFSQLTTK